MSKMNAKDIRKKLKEGNEPQRNPGKNKFVKNIILNKKEFEHLRRLKKLIKSEEE